MADSSPDNGRVTLAVLNTKLDTVIKEVEMLRRDMVGVAAWCTESRTRWTQHDKEHDELTREMSTRRNVGDIIVGTVAVIAGVLGITIKP